MPHLLRSLLAAGLALCLGLSLSACDQKRPAPTAAEIGAMETPQVEKLAANDNIDAVVELSTRYANGNGVSKDEAKALELLGRAVAKNHPFGTYLMGVAHSAGMGVPKDESKAVLWFERAANLGDPMGQYWLAMMIGNGRGGIGASWENAFPLMLKAAEQGVSDARFMLGFMYHSGSGIEQDFEKAATWYRLASDPQINQKAQFNLRNMIAEGKIKEQPGDVGAHPVNVTEPAAPTASEPQPQSEPKQP